MPTRATGVVLQLRDSAKTTPFKQARITGMSFSVELRSLDIDIVRYDPQTRQMLPLPNFPLVLRLLTSNQTEGLSTDAAGHLNATFPDTNVEVRLNPGAVPAGHSAVLNYPVKTQKRNAFTVVFLPDSLRRYYPRLQFV